MRLRSVPIAVFSAVLLLLAAQAAEASAVCERLNAKLTDLPKATIISNANLRDYAAAISRQNLDLRQARSERRRAGCNAGSVVVIGAPQDDTCEGLGTAITQMEANLEDLKARRQQLVSGGDDTLRRRLLAALDVNRCAEEQDEILQAAAAEPESHRNILKDLPPIRESILSDQAEMPNFALPGDDYGGSLRTMCVRTCDGAFFPISSNATPADFQRDAETCRRRCPGAETALYYHALTTEESEQMISASTGEPYIDLPTAFAYKTRDPAAASQCGCAPAKTANQSTPQQGSIITITTGAPQSGLQTKSATSIPERPYDPQDKKVRVIGPSFLPTQESSIDLHHPAGPAYQEQQPN
ncbi:hypothetical protein QO002_002702 [Pararhizobium capsulatum DSM 1112]|uniref:DUF2865 domain-containing protein n=1 Tax=Pararhizobium capsulatum DSM 1112 TaxID=1121113 RepID=A0ABU0BQP4_9HYPH|nr:DUF2865 domain-containing protein [Pararhizobium capsulatum]MDQ0320564.1 hypothetical protein [Pararhizobium capsulatum DSM 1112]